MSIKNGSYDLPKIIFGILSIVVMLSASFWIVLPFILSFIWAGMIVIATWPLLLRLERYCGGRRSIAALIMVLLLLVLFALPLVLLGNSLAEGSHSVMAWLNSLKTGALPDGHLLQQVPVVGSRLYEKWHFDSAGGAQSLLKKVEPYLAKVLPVVLGKLVRVGSLLGHVVLMLVFSGILYVRGEHVVRGLRHFAFRLGNQRGDNAVVLGGQTIKAVAMGIVVTALVQSALGGIGLAVCGINNAVLLTVLMFILCLAQVGPLVVLVPAMVWLFWHGDTTWGSVLVVWGGVVGMLDNVLRPMLIRKGADLPMALILTGVIGGLLAFGMIGLFIGPVILAVSFRLVSAWTHEVSLV
ncbi:AI-2E family transporter YdiK [Klebsiella aerogenes]|uniref:AI-2E family transporter YdiK n=1 Tax=Klebsiella aerogenes TaxID=548 RepID=UPI0034D214FA